MILVKGTNKFSSFEQVVPASEAVALSKFLAGEGYEVTLTPVLS